MSARFDFANQLGRRVLRVRMNGIFDEETMRAWVKQYRELGTQPYRGKKHMVIADMRGMRTLHPSVAALMGAEIGYARRNGVVLCAHLSDDTVQRLQAARIARQNSPFDDVTVDVDSLAEAERVITAGTKFLDDVRFGGSIRDAISATAA